MTPLRRILGPTSLRAEWDRPLLEIYVRRAVSALFYKRLWRRRNADAPYWTPRAVREVGRFLGREMSVFEWGSGLSTQWLARRVASLTVIEHDPFWYDQVQEGLDRERLDHVRLQLFPFDDGFAAYASAIASVADGSLDLIAVDGRARVDCIRSVRDKVRPGGLVLLDDSHRARYAEAFRLLDGFDVRRFECGLMQTTLWRRPSEPAKP